MALFIHWNDIPILLSIVAAVLVPEAIVGFGNWQTRTRLAILTAFCVLATFLSVWLQQADPGATFTRAFLIAMVARISLILNHSAHEFEALFKHEKHEATP